MHLHFAVPGDLDTPTGGYAYDRRLIEELTRVGWDVTPMPLAGAYPRPTAADRADAARAFAAIPDGSLVLVDGLAGGALPDVLAAETARLRCAALVHHPLADETGLAPELAACLAASERRALRSVSRVICTSRRTAARLADAFAVPPDRLTVAPPGTAGAPRAPRAGTPPRILSVGSLIPRKRHDVLIAALARLADRPWLARIVGSDRLDPGCADVLRDSITLAGLQDRITLTGVVPETGAEYATADLFALASAYEGYGMACAEALAHGLPIVAAAAPAVADLVPQAAGALVPVGDPDAFAAALAALLDDPARRDKAAEAAQAAGQALPTWADTAATVAAALERLA